MTISKYITEWLKLFENIEVDICRLKAEADSYGLFRSATRSISNFTDGSYTITEAYDLFIRQNSIAASERLENDEFIEKLAYWIDDYGFNYEYPEFEDDSERRVENIALTGAPYSMLDENDNVVYQVSLSITYLRKRGE